MTVIYIDRAFVLDKLNALPVHSRRRAGYCDILKHFNRLELESDRLGKVLVADLEEAFRDYSVTQIDAESPSQAQRIRETY